MFGKNVLRPSGLHPKELLWGRLGPMCSLPGDGEDPHTTRLAAACAHEAPWSPQPTFRLQGHGCSYPSSSVQPSAS